MDFRKVHMRIALLLFATILIAACGGAPTANRDADAASAEGANAAADTPAQTVADDAPRAEQQVLRVAPAQFADNVRGDLAILDPARRGTWSFHALLWAPLVWGDAAGNPNPEKSLAESWEVSEDGTVYTFHLREDAKFSDGSPITAEDVALSFGHWGMLLHPESTGYRSNGSVATRFFFDIVGMLDFPERIPYEEFSPGEVGDIPGIEVVDDHTLTITLVEPSVTFLTRIMAASGIFRPSDLAAGAETEYNLLDYWPAYAVSSGPYKLAETVPGERYTLVSNEHYFGPAPTITEIRVSAVSEDMNTILTAFANEELDMVTVPLNGAQARQALEDPYLSQALVEVPDWRVEQLWITPNAPLNDVHVRRAFSMAINKEALVSILNAGSAQPLYRTVNMHRNPNVPHCEAETAEVVPLPYDVEQAQAELEQSEYWPEVLDMEIHIYAATTDDLVVLEAVAKMLQDNLGMNNVTIHTERIPNVMAPPYPIHLRINTQQPWYADLTDTLREMTRYLIGRDQDWTAADQLNFRTPPYVPELRDLAEEAMTENDPDRRCQLIAEIGQMWNDTAYSLDYGEPVSYYLIAPWVQGNPDWYNAARGIPLDIEEWWIAEH